MAESAAWLGNTLCGGESAKMRRKETCKSESFVCFLLCCDYIDNKLYQSYNTVRKCINRLIQFAGGMPYDFF